MLDNTSSRPRDIYWDTLKFLLIFLVVWGHFTEVSNPVPSLNRAIFNFIYLFHMPLFVFVSGRFSHVSDRAKYLRGILRLLETYLLFQVIFLLQYGTLSFSALLTPWFHMWYLITLIFYRLAVLITPPRWLNHRSLVLFITFAVALLAGFLPVGRFLSLQRTLALLPFFALGYYSTTCDLQRHLRRIPRVAAALALILIFGAVYFFLNKDLTRMLVVADPYYADSTAATLANLAQRALFLVAALLLGLLFLRLVPRSPALAACGRQSLVVYIFHAFLLHQFRASLLPHPLPQTLTHHTLFPHPLLPPPLPHHGLWLLLYAAATVLLLTLLTLLLSRLKLPARHKSRHNSAANHESPANSNSLSQLRLPALLLNPLSTLLQLLIPPHPKILNDQND